MATQQQAPEEAAPRKRGFRFPTAFTVLFFVLILVWLLTFVLQPGSYTYVSCDGSSPKPIPGSYEQVDTNISFGERLYDLFISPVNGLYGLREPSAAAENVDPAVQAEADAVCGEGVAAEVVTPPGLTGPYTEPGVLVGAVAVFFFVLAIGAFITVTLRTGALDAGIGRLTHRYRTRGLVLITVLMIVFSVGGTTYGMAEETLGFYVLIVPIMVALGYDRMVGVATIMIGAGIGTLASTVNPFATAVASDAAGTTVGDGLPSRFIIYLVLTTVAILYVLRYARRVKSDPSRSLLTPLPGDSELAGETAVAPPPMTGKQKLVMWLFALWFVVMIVSVIPWADLWSGFAGFADVLSTFFMPWYFPELAAWFIVGAIVIGLIGGLGEQRMVDSIITGMGDFLGAAAIIALARGVTVVMNNAGVTDTVLHSMENLVTGKNSGVFAVLMYVVNIPLAFLVPSSSGHATLAMPIMAPLADFADVGRSIVVTAYQSASGWVNLFTPTSAIVMGGLALAKVGYDKFLRFIVPLLVILFVLVSVLLVIFAPMSNGSFA